MTVTTSSVTTRSTPPTVRILSLRFPRETPSGHFPGNTPPDPTDALLGRHAKFAATRPARGSSSGSVAPPTRWALQSEAGRLLPGKRVASCLKVIAGLDVQVYFSAKSGRASLGGLQTCGSSWDCPVCAAKIAARRTMEVGAEVEVHQRAGGVPVLLTLTVRHHLHQRLADLLPAMAMALSRMKAHRRYKKLMAAHGCIGETRALEVTHGENGWHPHVHTILYLSNLPDLAAFEAEVRALWEWAVVRAGLAEVNEHGVLAEVVDDKGHVVGRYFGKAATNWTAADELARANTKQGRAGGRTPFALLADSLAGDREAGRLFREYSDAFHGRNQLTRSPGLRERLLADWTDTADTTDEEVAATPEPDGVLLGIVDVGKWRVVVRLELRAELLEVASCGLWDTVEAWLACLPELPRVGGPEGPERPVGPPGASLLLA